MRMSTIGNTLKVLSANCQGMKNLSKTTDVLSYFKAKNPNMKSHARGVAILLNKNFEYEVVESNYDDERNYLYVQLK